MENVSNDHNDFKIIQNKNSLLSFNLMPKLS